MPEFQHRKTGDVLILHGPVAEAYAKRPGWVRTDNQPALSAPARKPRRTAVRKPTARKAVQPDPSDNAPKETDK